MSGVRLTAELNRCTAASAVLLNSLADRVKVRKSVGQPGRERESRMCEFPMGDCDVHANNAIEEDVQLIETWKVKSPAAAVNVGLRTTFAWQNWYFILFVDWFTERQFIGERDKNILQ